MPSQSEDEEIYDVEYIVDDRVIDGRKEYLIKWAGYAAKHNTWESEANILSEELKKEYEDSKAKKKAKSSVPKKVSKFEPKVTNEWADKISKVVAVFMNDEKQLEVEYETCEGQKAISPAIELHVKAPIKLLNFYESNINFSD